MRTPGKITSVEWPLRIVLQYSLDGAMDAKFSRIRWALSRRPQVTQERLLRTDATHGGANSTSATCLGRAAARCREPALVERGIEHCKAFTDVYSHELKASLRNIARNQGSCPAATLGLTQQPLLLLTAQPAGYSDRAALPPSSSPTERRRSRPACIWFLLVMLLLKRFFPFKLQVRDRRKRRHLTFASQMYGMHI